MAPTHESAIIITRLSIFWRLEMANATVGLYIYWGVYSIESFFLSTMLLSSFLVLSFMSWVFGKWRVEFSENGEFQTNNIGMPTPSNLYLLFNTGFSIIVIRLKKSLETKWNLHDELIREI